MQQQTSPERQRELAAIADRHGFSVDAVQAMYEAVRAGNGSMAQFNHPEFSGFGQWMRGGMTMVSDMFNNHLKSRVDALCGELAALAPDVQAPREGGVSTPGHAMHPAGGGQGSSGNWWPAELQWPSSSGTQNGMRYAYFAGPRRLVIDNGGQVTVYDTLDHQIGGVSQQQSYNRSLTFSSQHGPVDLSQLPVVSSHGHG